MPTAVELAELAKASYEDSAAVRFPHVKPGAALVAVAMSRYGGNPGPAFPGGPFQPPGFASWPGGNQTTPAFLQQPGGAPQPPGFVPPPLTDVVWNRTERWDNPVGFSASVYARPGGGRVLAFRGTDDAWDGLVDDVAITVGGMPPQAYAALATAQSVRLATSDYITGHSLGGALALIAAAHLGLPAVTFNAPGVADSCVMSTSPLMGLRRLHETVARCGSNARVRNFRIEGDPVSSVFTTGLQAGGAARSLPAVQCGFDGLCRHGIRTCIAAVRADPANYDPLAL